MLTRFYNWLLDLISPDDDAEYHKDCDCVDCEIYRNG